MACHGGDGAVGEGSFRQGLEDVELKMEIGKPGQSCDDVCAERSLKCQADLLPRINNCPLLRHFFPCTPGCFASMGAEQPTEVVEAPLDIASYTPQHIHLLENPSRQNPQQRRMLQDLRGYSRQGQGGQRGGPAVGCNTASQKRQFLLYPLRMMMTFCNASRQSCR
ncbi:unnamed protein product [Closterium sp. Yama58-4]|nr:unnamed protein product [Closterium sp. Yama58-4]